MPLQALFFKNNAIEDDTHQLQNGISGKAEREKEGIEDELIVLVTLFKKYKSL